jgi:hypothetical protein
MLELDAMFLDFIFRFLDWHQRPISLKGDAGQVDARSLRMREVSVCDKSCRQQQTL